MNNENKFFFTLQLTIQYVEEILITGADMFAVDELLFGRPPMPGSLPLCFSLPTSFDLWKGNMTDLTQ